MPVGCSLSDSDENISWERVGACHLDGPSMSFNVLFVVMVGPRYLLDYSPSIGYTTSYNQLALFATKGIHSLGLSREWVSLDSIVILFQMFPTSRRALRLTCFVPGTYMSQYAGDYMKYMSNGSSDAWTYLDHLGP